MTNRKLAYIVKDQKPLVLAETETVGAACRLMCERGAGSVLVVGKGHQLSGIFTGRDAVRLIAKVKEPAGAKLAKAMTSGPVTVTPECSAIEALKKMAAGGFRHIPVTEDDRILGVVSKGDFKGKVREIIEGKEPLVVATTRTVRESCQTMIKRTCGFALVADSHSKLKGIFTGRDAVRALANSLDTEKTPVSKAMTASPTTIGPGARSIEALRAMSDGCFRHLPVVEDGQVLGVVTRADFTGYEIDQLDEQQHLWECIW